MKLHFVCWTSFAFSFIFHFLLPIANSSPTSAAVPKRRLKILIYNPSLGWSHSQFLGAIGDTLEAAGHEVHLLKFVSDRWITNRNETKLVRKIYRFLPEKTRDEQRKEEIEEYLRDAFAGNAFTMLSFMNHPLGKFYDFAFQICQEMAQKRELFDELAKEKFDVGISELYDLCPIGLLHRAGVRTKLVAFAAPLFQMTGGRRFGIPGFPSFMPNIVPPIFGDGTFDSFPARLFNFYNEMYDWFWMDNRGEQEQDALLRENFGTDFPKLREIGRNASLVFTNTNPFFETPRPKSNKIVHIGGLVDQLKEQQMNGQKEKLDEETKHLLDSSPGGVVLLSFGSIAETRFMSTQMRRSLLRAFGQFPSVQFLVKMDTETIGNESALLAAHPNIHPFQWIQQSAVLQHPNLRAFITHCGQNSLTEAAFAGVPVLGIPLFGDQRYNCWLAQHSKIGIQLNTRALNGPNSQELIFQAMGNILNDPIHRQNAQLIRQKLTKMPFKAAENLVRWVEFAAEFDNLNELNLPGDDQMHWFVYYSLDAITFTLAISIGICWLAWTLLRWMIVIMPMAFLQEIGECSKNSRNQKLKRH